MKVILLLSALFSVFLIVYGVVLFVSRLKRLKSMPPIPGATTVPKIVKEMESESQSEGMKGQ